MDTGKDGGGTATMARPTVPPRRRARRTDPLPSPVTGRVAPSAAAIARPLLVLLPVLTFLVPSLLVAFTKAPTHTSEARLLVGGFDAQAQAIPGFVSASQSLASTYARLVSTPAIGDVVAKSLGQSAGSVSGHISATPVPESSIIRVEGKATSAAAATRFAQAAAEAVLSYARLTAGGDQLTKVASDYQAAAQANAAAQDNLDRTQRAVTASANPSAELLLQLAQARAAADTAKLEADTLATQYKNLQAAAGSSGQVRIVAPAVYIGDNRKSTVELAIAGSVGLGLIAGIALATLVVNQQVGRRPSRAD
jgi:hypothetical protein